MNTKIADNSIQKILQKLVDGQLELSNKIDSVNSELSTKIDGVNSELSTEINSVNSELTNKIGNVNSELSNKIDSVHIGLSNKIDIEMGGVHQEIVNLKNETKDGFKKVNERIDKIGLQLANLEDDAPTREEFENLTIKVKKVENVLLSA